MRLRQARLRQSGVTLIEQIMTVAIMGVLAAVAIPPLSQLLARNQVQTAQLDFIATLQHARATAITSGKSTLFCPSRDGTHCSNETRWEGGWLLAHDPMQANQPLTVLRHGSAYAHITVLGDAGRRFMRFHGDGSASGSTNTLRLCRRGHPEQALVVVVSNAGRVRGATASTEQAASCAAAP